MHHEYEARQRRQLELDILGAGQDIFVKPKHGMHTVSYLPIVIPNPE
jgi:hypothetical protein